MLTEEEIQLIQDRASVVGDAIADSFIERVTEDGDSPVQAVVGVMAGFVGLLSAQLDMLTDAVLTGDTEFLERWTTANKKGDGP